MRPQPFVHLHLAPTLRTQLPHGPITTVVTHLEIGWHEQPIGLRCETGDGWAYHVQFVGGTGPGGFDDADGYEPIPSDAYAQPRRDWQARQASTRAGRTARPDLRFGALLDWCAAIAKGLHLPALTAVEVIPAGPTRNRPVLRADFIGGHSIHGLPVGIMPPGATTYANRPHEIPEETR